MYHSGLSNILSCRYLKYEFISDALKESFPSQMFLVNITDCLEQLF